jgi:hypothetical protein
VTLLLALIFLLPILAGGMIVHLLWPEREFKILVFKSCLGIGLGLGLSSLLYFLYRLAFAGGHWFIVVQLALFLSLLAVTIRRERGQAWPPLPRWDVTPVQGVLAALGLIVFIVSLLSTASYLLRRKQGDWDAWMMFNRAARFVYRDPADWLGSFSPQMDPIFHADYPLLLAMNTASGWDALGTETARVPMIQSTLFAVGCLGLAVSALASFKSAGQAALGLIILWGTPILVNEGARQQADVPMAFFILATGILIHLFVLYRKPGLIVLAGLAAGLAGWTKNEGSLFVIAAGLGLALAFLRENPGRVLSWYLLGLAFPLAIVLYFKVFLAPPSDVLSNGISHSIQQSLDLSRHLEILGFFARQFFLFGRRGTASVAIGILPILLAYFLLFRLPIRPDQRNAYAAWVTMLVIQALGYYLIYLITPYDLKWHLGYSGSRILIQVLPLITFAVLCASRTPESVFDFKSN